MPAKKSKAVTALDILRYARALLAKRGGWTKEVLAEDRQHYPISYENPAACRFCASGAIFRAQSDLGAKATLKDRAFTALGYGIKLGYDRHDIPGFNDRQTTKRPVIAAFDRAIAKLEAQHG